MSIRSLRWPVAGLTALALALGLLLPWLVGRWLAVQLPALVAGDASARIGPYALSELAVDAGWFGSRVSLRGLAPGRPPLVVLAELAHGPWTGLPPGWLAGDLALTVDGAVAASGAVRIGPGFGLTAELAPAPAHGTGALHVEASLAEGSLAIRSADLAVRPWIEALEGRLVVAASDAAPFEASLRAAELAWGAGRVTELMLEAAIERRDDRVAVRLAAATAAGRLLASPVQALRGELELAALHGPTLAQLGTALGALADAGALTPEAALRTVASAVPALLVHQPAVPTLALLAEASAGRFELAAAGAVVGPPPFDVLRRPGRLLAVVDGRLRGRADATLVAALVASAPEAGTPTAASAFGRMIAGWEREGWLVRDGDAFVSAIDLERGRVTINGRCRAPCPPAPSSGSGSVP